MNKDEDIEAFTFEIADLMQRYGDKLNMAVIGHLLISTASNGLVFCIKDPLDAMKVIAVAIDQGIDDGKELLTMREKNE